MSLPVLELGITYQLILVWVTGAASARPWVWGLTLVRSLLLRDTCLLKAMCLSNFLKVWSILNTMLNSQYLVTSHLNIAIFTRMSYNLKFPKPPVSLVACYLTITLNTETGSFLFFKYIYWLCYYSCPISPPTPLHPAHPPPSHIPPHSSCPWVILISSLASTFPILFLPSPCLFSTYHLCYLFSIPFPPLPIPLPCW